MGVEDSFKVECEKAFGFLVDEFHCRLVPDWFSEYRAARVYQNDTTAVLISLELDYPGLFVMFLKLVDGKIPKESFNRGFYLTDLVALRAPDYHYAYNVKELWDPKKVKEIVFTYAFLTKKHAADILRGDFRVFKDLEKIIRERAEHLRDAEDSAPEPE
jgi:hypothetical protein